MGLADLIALKNVLGGVPFVFVAMLADKPPPHQHDRMPIIGPTLALGLRLALLAAVAWSVTLAQPLFRVTGSSLVWRGLFRIARTLFLRCKGTAEPYRRLENHAVHRMEEACLS